MHIVAQIQNFMHLEMEASQTCRRISGICAETLSGYHLSAMQAEPGYPAVAPFL
jgi:hypothetical protein